MKINALSVLSLFSAAFLLCTGCTTEKTDPSVASAETCGTCGVNTASVDGISATTLKFGGVAVAAIELPDGRRFDVAR